jgi:hypothetical protein
MGRLRIKGKRREPPHLGIRMVLVSESVVSPFDEVLVLYLDPPDGEALSHGSVYHIVEQPSACAYGIGWGIVF